MRFLAFGDSMVQAIRTNRALLFNFFGGVPLPFDFPRRPRSGGVHPLLRFRLAGGMSRSDGFENFVHQ
jgi:hypothetical protein